MWYDLGTSWAQVGGLNRPSFFVGLLIISLSAAAIILWRRYRSRQALMARIAELESLSSAGRSLATSQLEVRALCELIAQEAEAIIDTSTFQIGLFQGSLYRIEYWCIEGHREKTPRTFDLGDGSGLVGWVRESGNPLLVEDFQKEMDGLPARPKYIGKRPPRSAIFIPMISGEREIGIVAAQSSQPGAFNVHDLNMLSVLANQAGAAIANARMFELEQQRASYLELVSQIAQRVNAISDLEELLGQVVSSTKSTFEFEVVNIFTLATAGDQAILQAGSDPDVDISEIPFSPGTEGVVKEAVETLETSISLSIPREPALESERPYGGGRSEMALPLIVDETLLGVLYVSSSVPAAFTLQEQSALEALAAQVAIAMHKAEQLARQKEQRWLTMAQLQVAETLGRSANLDSIAESLARLVPMLVGLDHCAIFLWDEDSDVYFGAAEFGYYDDDQGDFKAIKLALGQWNALDAVHIGQQHLTTHQPPPWIHRDKKSVETSSTLLPLVANGRTIGVIVTGTEEVSGPEVAAGRLDLLRDIASQAAQSIDSVQLRIAQQEEAWVNTALLQVAEAINQLTDLDEILGTIVRLLPMLVGVRSSVILIWNEEHGTYKAGPGRGISEMGRGLLESFEVDLSEFLLLGTRDVERISPDAAYYTFQLPHWMHAVLGAETADIFPLYSRGHRVGALVVGPSRNDRPLRGRRLNIVSGIAQQAAIALVNNQLYKESAERTRIEQELEVARSIQSSLMPESDPIVPGCTIASYWEAARQVSGDFYDYMALPDGRWGIAIADVADKGVPASLFMALSRTILRTIAFNRLNPADTLRRSNEIIFSDSYSDLFVTIFYAIWDPNSDSLIYSSAGHNPPVLVHSDGSVSLLHSKGVALGVLPTVEIAQNEVRVAANEAVVFYTDGVTEAMNEDLDEFGLERLSLTAKANRRSSAAGIVTAITTAIDLHCGDTPQFDDITMVVLKR